MKDLTINMLFNFCFEFCNKNGRSELCCLVYKVDRALLLAVVPMGGHRTAFPRLEGITRVWGGAEKPCLAFPPPYWWPGRGESPPLPPAPSTTCAARGPKWHLRDQSSFQASSGLHTAPVLLLGRGFLLLVPALPPPQPPGSLRLSGPPKLWSPALFPATPS